MITHKYIKFDNNNEYSETEGVIVERKNGNLSIIFKQTPEGEKAKEIYKKLIRR